MTKYMLNKVPTKKFKILIKLNNLENFFSVDSLSSVMSQSRILEPELVDDYFVDLFNNLYLDLVSDENSNFSIDIKLPLILYFFKKEKTLLYIKSIYINNILQKYYNKLYENRTKWLLRLRFFLLNNYESVNHVKALAYINKKKQPKESKFNFRYINTVYENFKLTSLKSMPYIFNNLSYSYLHDSSTSFSDLFYSHLDKEFMKSRKINFRRKNKK